LKKLTIVSFALTLVLSAVAMAQYAAQQPDSKSGVSMKAESITGGFMDPDAVGKPLIFIADAGLDNEEVDIFLQSDRKMVGQITGLSPEGLATDAARNLYIANTGYMNILIYAPPYLTVTLTLGDGNNIPRAVAVSRKGLVAVANVCTL